MFRGLSRSCSLSVRSSGVSMAFFSFLPLVRPSTEFSGELTAGTGWTAWIGASIFEIGSVFLMIEALNESHAACFGWEVKQKFEGEVGKSQALVPDSNGCVHNHRKGRIWKARSLFS